MTQSALLKYALVAGGCYLLFNELRKSGALGIPPHHPHHPHHPPPPPPSPSYFPQWGPWMGYGQPPIILQLPPDMVLPGPEDFGIDGTLKKKSRKKSKKVVKEEEE